MNDWSPGYEPDGISWLPYLAILPPIVLSYLTLTRKERQYDPFLSIIHDNLAK